MVSENELLRIFLPSKRMCEKIRNEYDVLAVKLQAQRSVEVPAGVLEDNIKVTTEEDSFSERSNSGGLSFKY